MLFFIVLMVMDSSSLHLQSEHVRTSTPWSRRGMIGALILPQAAMAASEDLDMADIARNVGKDRNLDLIVKRVSDEGGPAQLNALTYGPRGDGDSLVLPEWMLGEWTVRSRLTATAAPLGRKFLPQDLQNMVISRGDGDADAADRQAAQSTISKAPGLEYRVRFLRRPSDSAVVADRPFNLKSVQDAAAGYQKVAQVTVKEAGRQLSVQYLPFDRKGER